MHFLGKPYLIDHSAFKADNDKKNFERLTDAIKESKRGKTIGVFSKDPKLSGLFLVS